MNFLCQNKNTQKMVSLSDNMVSPVLLALGFIEERIGFLFFFSLNLEILVGCLAKKKKVYVVTNDLVILLTRNLVDFITKAMYVVLF